MLHRYPIADSESGEFLPVATTRPETILGDTAVAVHPEDERYKQYVGRECIVPMSGGRRIIIIADDYVNMEFGTGALKITPGGLVRLYNWFCLSCASLLCTGLGACDTALAQPTRWQQQRNLQPSP